MKGRLRNVKITEEQRVFAEFRDDDFATLSLLKNKFNKFILEFCCGTGDFLTEYAKIEPQTFFLGIDYAENAYLRALKKSYKNKLINCKFYNNYIQKAIENLVPEFYDIIYISFPDPWPKRRHTSRRLVTKQFLKEISVFLKKDGYCIIITDNKWYQEFIDNELNNEIEYEKFFENWFTEKEDEFLSNFKYFPSNYYNKAKKVGNVIRYYVLKNKNL